MSPIRNHHRRHPDPVAVTAQCDSSGRPLLTTTLAEPGALLVGDDRRTLHGVSPMRPIDGSGPAQRDVLVMTVAPTSRR
ncbi:2OG-Fe dioxygenase family protein [Mycobacterium sp. ML4]